MEESAKEEAEYDGKEAEGGEGHEERRDEVNSREQERSRRRETESESGTSKNERNRKSVRKQEDEDDREVGVNDIGSSSEKKCQ